MAFELERGSFDALVFDCDGTLWSGDAGSSFMKWSIETGLVSREAADWIDARYRAYHRNEVSEIAICGEMVQLYQGLREDELRQCEVAGGRDLERVLVAVDHPHGHADRLGQAGVVGRGG